MHDDHPNDHHTIVGLLALPAVALGVQAVPELTFIVQGFALGGIIGSAIAVVQDRRGRHPDFARLVARWSLLVAALFTVLAAAAELVL